ncbi:hypothetical protein [Xylanibacter muris]|uniref:DUF4384 domain-containing protein n=1 Tax=Xylanibacter muris TaxID=2736290 RepID=A0ABX2AKJ9_9BACT|nr:hypothetical protein [Xylanibacter muris]NPD91729.1 hypothetical protein [Xylanibacter muris]
MKFVGVILCGVLLFPLHVQSKVKKDTIYTTDDDRIIITYDITHSAGQTTIRFTGQQKKLGKINSKYKNLSKVAVMFFDRTGNYSGDVSVTNMIPEAFMTPEGVQYQKSADGFYLIQSEPKLSFTVKSDADIQIPIYLAYKPKKGKYVLFSKSQDLRIHLGTKKSAGYTKAAPQIVQQTITSTMETESDNTVEIKVLESVNAAKSLISETTELPFSDNLLDEINYLRQKRREITDNSLLSEITDVLDRYESKKRTLEEKSTAEQIALQQAEELRAKKEAQAIKAQNDSIAAAQQSAAEKEKKRNFWMIIGGIVFAILAFIGNQVFQGIRNKRNQMQMMNMQQNIADRAEAEAKRRARNSIRTQRNRIINEARQKTSDAIRRNGTLNVNGKSKKASI